MTSPFVVIAITIAGIVTLAAILGVSTDYMDSALTAQDTISIQNARGSEDLVLTIDDNTLNIDNNSANPVRIKEIRVLDMNTETQISRIDYSKTNTEEKGLRVDAFERTTLKQSNMRISDFDDKKVLAITDLGNIFVAKPIAKDSNNNSGQGGGGGVFGNSGTFRTLDLAGQVIHGQGITGDANSLKSYTDVDPPSDFAAVVLDDDRVITMSIPEFTSEYKYNSESLEQIKATKPNIMSFAKSRTI